MSLQTRLTDLITAVGADVKALYGRAGMEVPTFSFPGSLSLYTGTMRWFNDSGRTMTIQYVRASVGTQPAGANIIVDVLKNSTTIFTTTANRPSILAGGLTTRRSNMDITTLEDQSYLTMSIIQIGSTTPGSDLTVQVGLV